jgi:glycosyltransferase involved in cell wall biosynthesis
MRACDVFVLPSVREGLPIAVLEAMASGLAVIASDIPEIAGSQITDGEEGLLFPTGDVEALHSRMGELVRNQSTRQSLASAARLRAEQEFSTVVVDRQYLTLYHELLRSHDRQVVRTNATRPDPNTQEAQ